MNTLKENKWQIFAGILLAAQVITGIIGGYQICATKMLPTVALVLVLVFLVALVVLSSLLMLINGKEKTARTVRRVFGAIISVIAIVVSSVIIYYVGILNSTMSSFNGEVEVSNVIGVYVLADNSAENIQDAKDYKFGVSTVFDYDNSNTTIQAINEELSKDITVVKLENVTDIAKALYKGEVDAIILNTAYVSVLEDQKKYSDFSTQTKLIYKYEIIEEVDETEETETEEVKLPITERTFAVYLSGNDGLYSKLSTSRSDVNMIAFINPMTKQILLLNTPRDYYVLTEKSNYTQYDKLTHCGLYGPECSMGTLGKLYDTEIEYYMQINFTGFSTLVNAIGGVTVDNDRSFRSVDGYSFSSGTINLYGETALAFVRERKAFRNGDIQRGENQMKVIKAIVEKAKTSDALITNYAEVLAGLEGMFTTNVSSDEMSELVKMQLADGGDWKVVSYSVSGKGSKNTTYTVPNKKAYVMLQDENDIAKAKTLIQKIYNNEELSEDDVADADN